MSRADHDIRVSTVQLAELFTDTALGQHFAIGVDATDPAWPAGSANLLEGADGLWHACGGGFDPASLGELAAVIKATKEKLGQCGKPQGSHKGEHGYTFRAAAPELGAMAPLSPATLAATFPHTVIGRGFAMILGARGAEDRHILLGLLVERGGMLQPMARFGSEWIDDLTDITAEIIGR